ncbi:MAG: hypothetical protein OXT67_14110, partial [Zetaproteobacteria bacterium]|nr:hypothetical protein [Zetaproteobacteria bacterium]
QLTTSKPTRSLPIDKMQPLPQRKTQAGSGKRVGGYFFRVGHIHRRALCNGSLIAFKSEDFALFHKVAPLKERSR